MDECWEQDRSHLTARETESQRESERQGDRERIAGTCFATPSCLSTKITCAT